MSLYVKCLDCGQKQSIINVFNVEDEEGVICINCANRRFDDEEEEDD